MAVDIELCEGTLGVITIQQRVIRKGYVFQPNNQYCYKRIDTRSKGCGCGGNPKKIVNYYIVEIAGIDYEIDERFAVKTDIPISKFDQNFDNRIAHIGDNYGFSFQDLLIKPDPDKIFAEAQIVRM
jgi:hypothetical protein